MQFYTLPFARLARDAGHIAKRDSRSVLHVKLVLSDSPILEKKKKTKRRAMTRPIT